MAKGVEKQLMHPSTTAILSSQLRETLKINFFFISSFLCSLMGRYLYKLFEIR